MKALPRLTTPVSILFLLIIALTYIVNAMDRIVFPTLLPAVSKEYGFAIASGGLLATIFTLGLGIAGIPGGYLFDRMSRKMIAALGILIYSGCTILTCLSVSFYDMALYRAVSGVGEGLQNAAIFTIAGAYFAANRTLAFGVLNVAYGIGSFIGPRWGASLLADYGTWRAPLYIYGWIGVAGAVLMYVVLSRRFSEQQALTSAADVALEAHIPDTLVNKNTILLALASIFAGLASYGYLGLYPTYLRTQLNFTLTESAAAASMYGAGALAGLLCGYMADRMNQKLITIGSMLGVMAVGYCIFNVATTPLWQDILSLLEGCLASGFIYVNNYSLMQRSVRSTISGRASGLVVTCVYLPAAVSGYLFAELEQNFGWGNAALIQMTILLIIPVVAMLFFDMSRTSCPSVTRRPVSPALPGDRIAAAAAVPPSHGG